MKGLTDGVGMAKKGTSQSTNKNVFTQREQRSFLQQCLILLKYELVSCIEATVTVYRFSETFGLGVTAGFVWFQTGASDLQTQLGEVVGLLYFSCALWTVPPVFQTLAITPSLVGKASAECLAGLYSSTAFVIASTLSSCFAIGVWVCAWQIVAYTLADVGASWLHMLGMHFMLFLNVLTMCMMGFFLALVVPVSMLNVVFANLIAQMYMMTSGFLIKVPDYLEWINLLCVPRYTFRALLKLEYSWTDTFQVHPMLGAAGAGFPTRYIPAELTGLFENMRHKGMDVMQSPYTATVLAEVLVLAGISTFFLAVTNFTLRRHINSLERGRAGSGSWLGWCSRLPKRL